MTGTLFRYDLMNPVVVERSTYTLANLNDDTIITGAEAIATFRRPFSVTPRIRMRTRSRRRHRPFEVPLTPDTVRG